ncbi:MAG: AraC family transcriptional regulator [Clostridia bacterium]|nr:AraC family transcriptional regulator [Clostridia bacterium]
MITNEIINRAIEYILLHIEEEISIDAVAEYCHFSKFYFSRVFKAETGESIYAFIKRVKMNQSAFRLKVERNRSVTDIGYEYGYSPSNYSSVFKKQHHESPYVFRKNCVERSIIHPFFKNQIPAFEDFETCHAKTTIEEIDDFFVLYERRIGNYYHLGENWANFMERYKAYLKEDTILLERTFDDPSITDKDSCLYDICMSVSRDCKEANTCIIQGGKFAVYHFTGHVSEIFIAYQTLFNVWLPKMKYEIDERYGFDI